MSNSLKLETKNTELLGSLQNFFRSILELDEISAILAPKFLPMKNMVMPVLISDPEQLDGVDPLSPAFPMNASKIVSRLTRKPIGGKIAVVLRPCEIRAFIELVKLKQGRTNEIILIGVDCLGAHIKIQIFSSLLLKIKRNLHNAFTAVSCQVRAHHQETLNWRQHAGPVNIQFRTMPISS